MKKVKLIWDFRGPEAQKIAEHHVIHLNQFAEKENLEYSQAGDEELTEMYSMAYMIVAESDMLKVRDALKPHRGEHVLEG